MKTLRLVGEGVAMALEIALVALALSFAGLALIGMLLVCAIGRRDE